VGVEEPRQTRREGFGFEDMLGVRLLPSRAGPANFWAWEGSEFMRRFPSIVSDGDGVMGRGGGLLCPGVEDGDNRA
jgi:hypothetical protein